MLTKSCDKISLMWWENYTKILKEEDEVENDLAEDDDDDDKSGIIFKEFRFVFSTLL